MRKRRRRSRRKKNNRNDYGRESKRRILFAHTITNEIGTIKKYIKKGGEGRTNAEREGSRR